MNAKQIYMGRIREVNERLDNVLIRRGEYPDTLYGRSHYAETALSRRHYSIQLFDRLEDALAKDEEERPFKR